MVTSERAKTGTKRREATTRAASFLFRLQGFQLGTVSNQPKDNWRPTLSLGHHQVNRFAGASCAPCTRAQSRPARRRDVRSRFDMTRSSTISRGALVNGKNWCKVNALSWQHAQG
jgi:hypothetical protein